MIMVIVSVEQRPGWGEHLLTEICDAVLVGPCRSIDDTHHSGYGML